MLSVRSVKHKKALAALLGGLAVLGTALAFWHAGDTGMLPAGVGTQTDADSSQITYEDLYSRQLKLGNKTVSLVVKSATYHSEDNGDWHYGEYQFYTTGPDPRLLAKIGSLTPPRYENETDPFFSMKDITGDGVPEILVMLQSSASNLRSYEILTLDADDLVNVTMRIGGENSKQIDFDDVALKGRFVAMTWHGPSSAYEVGRNDYVLTDDHSLMPVRSLSFVYGEDGESCDVRRTDMGDGESRTVAHEEKCGSGLDDFDAYLEPDLANFGPFGKDLEAALSDPKWSALAEVYKNECDLSGMPGSVQNPDSLPFRPLMESAMRRFQIDTGSLFLFPCGMGSYESSSLVTRENGTSFVPIPLVEVDGNGGRHVSYQAIEFSYDLDRDAYRTSHKPAQNASCVIDTEYRLSDGNELVVQKVTGDDNCDDEDFEEKVMYDATRL